MTRVKSVLWRDKAIYHFFHLLSSISLSSLSLRLTRFSISFLFFCFGALRLSATVYKRLARISFPMLLSLLIARCHFTTFFHLFSTLLRCCCCCYAFHLFTDAMCVVLYSDRQQEVVRLSTSLTFDWLVMHDAEREHTGRYLGTVEREIDGKKRQQNEDEQWLNGAEGTEHSVHVQVVFSIIVIIAVHASHHSDTRLHWKLKTKTIPSDSGSINGISRMTAWRPRQLS